MNKNHQSRTVYWFLTPALGACVSSNRPLDGRLYTHGCSWTPREGRSQNKAAEDPKPALLPTSIASACLKRSRVCLFLAANHLLAGLYIFYRALQWPWRGQDRGGNTPFQPDLLFCSWQDSISTFPWIAGGIYTETRTLLQPEIDFPL